MQKSCLIHYIGKFGTNPEKLYGVPYLGDDKVIHLKKPNKHTIDKKRKKDLKEGKQRGLYLPLASFVTSYAREITIGTAQKIMDYSINKYGKNAFVYSDTDSIHTWLSIEELKQFCDIDDYELGKWAFEGFFKKARFIRAKCYIEGNDEDISITCSGMPPKCYNQVTFENFKTGLVVGGKLTYKHVPRWCIISKKRFYHKR